MPRCCVGLLGYKSGRCQAGVYAALLRTYLLGRYNSERTHTCEQRGDINNQSAAAVRGVIEVSPPHGQTFSDQLCVLHAR